MIWQAFYSPSFNFSNSPSSVKVVCFTSPPMTSAGSRCFFVVKGELADCLLFFITAELIKSMLITQREINKFEKEVCEWLQTQGIILDEINIESHRSMNGYIVCWRSSSMEHVLISKELWDEDISDRNDFSRKIDMML